MLNKIGLYTTLCFIALAMFSSCRKSDQESYTISSSDDINEFVKEQKETLTYEKKIKEVNYKLYYISNEQMALKQINDISKINQTQYDSIVRNYDSLLFFNLEIDIDNFNGELLQYKLDEDAEASYNDRVDYYAFRMQKNISIVLNERDTIPCMLYHFERNYGISPKSNFMIGFKTPSIKNAVFVYENKCLKTGPIKFALQEKSIVHHPHIKIK